MFSEISASAFENESAGGNNSHKLTFQIALWRCSEKLQNFELSCLGNAPQHHAHQQKAILCGTIPFIRASSIRNSKKNYAETPQISFGSINDATGPDR